MNILFLFILEVLALQDVITAVVLITAGIITLKTGVLKSLSSTSKDLLDITIQEKEALKIEVKELKEENRLLRRENNQRIEINLQDQKRLRELASEVDHG